MTIPCWSNAAGLPRSRILLLWFLLARATWEVSWRTIGFFVRVADGRVEVGDHPIDDADLTIVSDYADALLIGRLRIVGDPAAVPAILTELDIHRLLSSRTS